ncbi:MAG: hypothetical protein JRJ44_00610 [Deltaproteobacteria bacterium]|nr:hypothetical protein [Deltaproteobacteria bacterium]
MFMIIWKYILRPSILDRYRDKLFDLREKTRDFYISNNISLNDDTYKNLRDMLNSHLRFTEKISFTTVSYFAIKINNDTKLRDYITKDIENQFKTNNKKLAEFIKKTREEAGRTLLNYMTFSSPLLILLFILILCFYISVLIIKELISSIKKDLNHMGNAAGKTSKIVGKYLAPDNALEKLSFEANKRLTTI